MNKTLRASTFLSTLLITFSLAIFPSAVADVSSSSDGIGMTNSDGSINCANPMNAITVTCGGQGASSSEGYIPTVTPPPVVEVSELSQKNNSAVAPQGANCADPIIKLTLICAGETATEVGAISEVQEFSGSISNIKNIVLDQIDDPKLAKSINSVMQKVAKFSKTTIKGSSKLPSDKNLNTTAVSLTSAICKVVNGKITVSKSGTCKIQYSVETDENRFTLSTSVKVKK